MELCNSSHTLHEWLGFVVRCEFTIVLEHKRIVAMIGRLEFDGINYIIQNSNGWAKFQYEDCSWAHMVEGVRVIQVV